MSAGNKKQSRSLTTPQTHSTLCLALTPWYKRHLLQNPIDTTNQWRHWPSVSHVLWPTHEFLKLTKHNRFLNFGHFFWPVNTALFVYAFFSHQKAPYLRSNQTSQRKKNRHRTVPGSGRGKTPLLRLDVHSEASHHWRIPFHYHLKTRKGQLGISSASWPPGFH